MKDPSLMHPPHIFHNKKPSRAPPQPPHAQVKEDHCSCFRLIIISTVSTYVSPHGKQLCKWLLEMIKVNDYGKDFKEKENQGQMYAVIRNGWMKSALRVEKREKERVEKQKC